MSSRELRGVEVLSRVKSKELKLVDAAALLEVSYRQAKRLWRRYRCEGAAGLKHRNVGRASPRAKPGVFRQQVPAGAGEVQRRGGAALRADAGRRTSPFGNFHSRRRYLVPRLKGSACDPELHLSRLRHAP